jgi:hypothetical protein
MKQGVATYLHSHPELRGNVSRVGPDWFEVTWHPFVKDRPETLRDRIDVRAASRRTRRRYATNDAKNIGFGVPSL